MEIFYKHRYLGSTLTLTWMFTTYYSYDYIIRAPPIEKDYYFNKSSYNCNALINIMKKKIYITTGAENIS